ncbi:MAG TPA: hypothetical protein VKY15_01670, partial [Acidimicrobiales bacterium]|nr:hypothetical protein [Acidimicrobiales bacterium]
MEPVSYSAMLSRRWPLVAALALVGAVVGAVLPPSSPSAQPEKTYRAVTLLGLGSANATAGSSASPGSGLSPSQVVAFSANQALYEQTAKALHTKASPPALAKQVKVRQRPNSEVISVSAVQPSAQAAASLANTFASALRSYVEFLAGQQRKAALDAANQKVASLAAQLEAVNAQIDSIQQSSPKPAGQARHDPQLELLQAQAQALGSSYGAAVSQAQSLAQAPPPQPGLFVLQEADPRQAVETDQAPPLLDRRPVRAGAGLVLGALAGTLAGLVLEGRDRRVRTRERAAAASGLAVLSEVPLGRKDLAHPQLFVVSQPESPAAEAFRMLHTQLMASGRSAGDEGPPPVQALMVVSPGEEATRPVVVANLAAALAESGRHVLVVTTAGLRGGPHPRGGPPEGIQAPKLDPAELDELAGSSQVPGVRTLALGHVLDGPGQLATLGPAVLATGRELADVVLVDAPPLLLAHDAEALAPGVDRVVVVAEATTTTCDQLGRAAELLGRVGAQVAGVVLAGT